MPFPNGYVEKLGNDITRCFLLLGWDNVYKNEILFACSGNQTQDTWCSNPTQYRHHHVALNKFKLVRQCYKRIVRN